MEEKEKKLHLGCGTRILDGFDNVDINKAPGICKSFDFNEYPWPIPDNTYDYIYSNHVLEHLRDIEKVMNEMHRICRPNAIIEINVPHMNNEGAFSMMGHISFFTEHTFRCLTDMGEDWREQRKRWEIISIDLIPSPNFGRYIPKFMRRKLSVVIRGVWKEIHAKLKVIK